MPSIYWKYFSKETNKAVCNLCSVNIKTCGNTTNLKTHLLAKHPNEIEFDDDLKNDQPTILNAFEHLKSLRGGDKAREIDSKLLWFMINNLEPFNIVENESFRAFVKYLCPRYIVPSRSRITKMLDNFYFTKQDLIKTHLKMMNFLSFSVDGWTDELNTRSYLGLTCHFIDNYECVSVCLCVKQMTVSHTSSNICSTLNEVFEEYEIDKGKIVSIVSDGARNMVNAVEQLVGSDKAIWCVAHKLNLVVNGSIKDCDNIKEIISSIRSLVKFAKQSNNFSDLINELQIENGVSTPLKLIQDVPTRWNSSYLMVERYAKLRSIVSMALIKVNRVELDIPFQQLDTISDIILLLDPFNQVTEDLSGERYVTVSRIIPVISMLRHAIMTCKPKSQQRKDFQGILCRHIDARFTNTETIKLFAYGTIMDPRFKNVDFSSTSASSKAIKEIEEMMYDVPLTQSSTPEISTNKLWSLHEEKCRRLNDNSSGLPSALKHYLSMPNLPLNENPLEFWKKNKDNWHQLHNMAIQYLTSPATSVPCERLFSKAGNVITEKRNRLKPKHVNAICFLNSLPKNFK